MAKLGYEDSLTGNMTGTGEATTQLKDIVKTLPLRVLSPADWRHWTTRGLRDRQGGGAAGKRCRVSSISSGNSRRWTRTIPRPGSSPSSATTR